MSVELLALAHERACDAELAKAIAIDVDPDSYPILQYCAIASDPRRPRSRMLQLSWRHSSIASIHSSQ
ncbi:hypothetical protein IVA95_28330 [Bradyrhizobium sp. 157]|nr:hypothetical protein [Bradyrhizobium sp. 157]